MPVTTNPDDPRLGHGVDEHPTQQNEVYLVLSDEERAKGFVRPVRHAYRHTGLQVFNVFRDLTDEEQDTFGDHFAKFEVYPENAKGPGRFWTQDELDRLNAGCNTVTSMNQAIAETYARNPTFYGSTWCMECRKHLPVAEFVWVEDGTVVGS